MLFVCGQCRYRFEADGGGQGPLSCPRCGRAISTPSADDDLLASEAEALSEEVVEAVEEGFAEVARQTAGRQVAVACGSCGKSLKVSARLAGKARRCPGCKAKIRIPYPEDEEDAAFLKRAGLAEGEGLDLVRGPSSSQAPLDGAPGQESAKGEEPADGAGPALPREAAEAGRDAVPRYHRAHPRPRAGSDERDRAAGALAAAVGAVGQGEPPAPPAAIDAAVATSTTAAPERSLADAATAASAAPATVDLDAARRQRLVKGAAGMVLGLCLAAGVIIASYHLFIRPSPSDDGTGTKIVPTHKGPGPPVAVDGSNDLATSGAIEPAATDGSTGSQTSGSTGLAAGRSTGPRGSTKPSIFTVPDAVMPPVPQPPSSPTEPKCDVREAASDLFLADGYCPAAPGRAYWKVQIEVTAGARPLVVNPFSQWAGLTCPEGNFPCSGLLEQGYWPSRRVVRREVSLEANQAAKMTLLFDVPQEASEAVLRLEGLSDVAVRMAAGDSGPGGTLWPGTYVESPPRNLQPLLKDPVMAALQSSPRLEMTVAKNAEGFGLSLPDASVIGTAQPAGGGTYAVRLLRGAASLEGKLRAATGGKILVLYLQDAPFHQITFTRQGTPAP